MKKYKTIIIGGGISGLACARTLFDKGKNDFLIISKEVGGRMLTSKSLTVDYGASYVTTEYKNVLNYIDKGDPLPLKDSYFIQNETIANAFHPKNLFHLWGFLKTIYFVNDFAKRLSKFRERSLVVGQKTALKEDSVLLDYTKMPAIEFVKKHKIEYLHETFFHPVLQSTVFTKANKCNAFYYLGILIPLVRKTYAADFRHVIPRITNGFKHKILIDKVISLKKNKKKGYLVKTKRRDFAAENVVIATPYLDAHKFFSVNKTGPIIPIYVLHVIGKREEVYQKKKVVFFKPEHHDITILWKQYSGSDIIFSKIRNPNLKKYYEYYHIVRNIYWRNSLMLSGAAENWLNQKLDDNLYLASDYNVCGLEDAYLTGVYAANQIIKKR